MDLLQQQAKQLTKAVHRRERRKAQAGPNEDGDEGRTRRRRVEPLKAAQSAYQAVLAATSLSVPPVQRCELCQATFTSDAQLQQHIAGPVHRKAVEKAAKQAAKQQHHAQYSALAENALQAAAWQDGRSVAQLTRSHMPHHHQQQQQHGQGQKGGKQPQQQRRNQSATGQAGQQQPEQQLLTHEQIMAQARHQNNPLSIDGWVPPSVASFVAAVVQQPTQPAQGETAPELQCQVAEDLPSAHAAHGVDPTPGPHPVLPDNHLPGLAFLPYGGSSSEGESDEPEEVNGVGLPDDRGQYNDEGQHQQQRDVDVDNGRQQQGQLALNSQSSGGSSSSGESDDEDQEPRRFESFF